MSNGAPRRATAHFATLKNGILYLFINMIKHFSHAWDSGLIGMFAK